VAKVSKFSAECRIGRLVEARLQWVATPDDVATFLRAMRAAFSVAGPRSVICADWRDADVFPPAVGDALIELLKNGNRYFERSALLLPAAHATFSLQVERLIREAGNPARRAFRAPGSLLSWLDDVLNDAERRRASDFLASPLI
jgi:hypothetical protein